MFSNIDPDTKVLIDCIEHNAKMSEKIKAEIAKCKAETAALKAETAALKAETAALKAQADEEANKSKEIKAQLSSAIKALLAIGKTEEQIAIILNTSVEELRKMK